MEFFYPLDNVLSYKNLSFIAISLLTAVMGIYSLKLFSILMPILTLILIWYQGGIKNISFHVSPPFVFLFFLLLWAGISTFWAYQPKEALKGIIALNFTFIFSVCFISALTKATPDLISKVSTLLKWTGGFLILLVAYQVFVNISHIGIFTKYKGAYQMKPTGSILALTSFVGCGFLWVNNNKFISVLTFFLLAILIYFTRCSTAFYGIILATFVFILSYMMPFWVTRITAVSSYIFLVLSPLFFVYVVSPSVVAQWPYFAKVLNKSLFHRFIAWELFSLKFFEHPFLGWGVTSARYIPMETLGNKSYLYGKKSTSYFQLGEVIHPHNNSIQVFVELGILGGLLYAFFFASLFWVVAKHVKDRLSVAVCNATLIFGFIAGEVTHNVWRNYWLALVTLTAGLLILFVKAREAQLRAEAGH
jgi:O-antigen ligase